MRCVKWISHRNLQSCSSRYEEIKWKDARNKEEIGIDRRKNFQWNTFRGTRGCAPRLRDKLKTIPPMEKSRRSSDGNRDTGTPYPIIATRLERNWSMWIRHFRNSTEAATHPTTVTVLHPPMRIAVSNKLNFSFPFLLSLFLSVFHPSFSRSTRENATRCVSRKIRVVHE